VLDGKGNTDAVRVTAVPSSVSRYSGGGYTVMQLLVSDVTGRPFHEYMRDAVLAPLGMTNSTYQQPLPADWAARTASGYYADRSPVSGKWHVYPEMAAAGLWTTATDLAKFAIETQQSLHGKSNKVLSQAMTREQLTDVSRSNYGLGLAVSGTGAALMFEHNGRDAGFDAKMVASADTGRGLVVMINANDNSGMMNRIAAAVGRKYNWPPRSASAPAATKGLTPAIPLDAVTGRYELSNNNMLTLVAKGESLFTDVNGLPDEEFLFMGGDRFGSTQGDTSFTIARDSSGAVIGLTWIVNGKERPIPRIGPLFASMKAAADPDPSFTNAVEAALRAFAQGGDAVHELSRLSPGARAELSGAPVRQFAGVRRITYVSSQDVTGRRIERHGGAVAKVLFYRVETAERSRFVLVHVTGDNLITDYDIVEK
jgi:hypothetical protein